MNMTVFTKSGKPIKIIDSESFVYLGEQFEFNESIDYPKVEHAKLCDTVYADDLEANALEQIRLRDL